MTYTKPCRRKVYDCASLLVLCAFVACVQSQGYCSGGPSVWTFPALAAQAPATRSFSNDCPLPTNMDPNILYINPNKTQRRPWDTNNGDLVVYGPGAGWALDPLYSFGCMKGGWCPYACKPGYIESQFDNLVGQPWAWQTSCNGQNVFVGAGRRSVDCSGGLLGSPCAGGNQGLYCGTNSVAVVAAPSSVLNLLAAPLNLAYTSPCVPSAPGVELVSTFPFEVSACRTIFPGSEIPQIPTTITYGQTIPITVPPVYTNGKPAWWTAGRTQNSAGLQHYFMTPNLGQSSQCLYPTCQWVTTRPATGLPSVGGIDYSPYILEVSPSGNPAFNGFNVAVRINCDSSLGDPSANAGNSYDSALGNPGYGLKIYDANGNLQCNAFWTGPAIRYDCNTICRGDRCANAPCSGSACAQAPPDCGSVSCASTPVQPVILNGQGQPFASGTGFIQACSVAYDMVNQANSKIRIEIYPTINITVPGQPPLNKPGAPTTAPTQAATTAPTQAATVAPTQAATTAPTQAATVAPTQAATTAPTQAATVAPTQAATTAPTQAATVAPTQAATTAPTHAATTAPTQASTTKAATAAPATTPRATSAPTTKKGTTTKAPATSKPTTTPKATSAPATTTAPTSAPTQPSGTSSAACTTTCGAAPCCPDTTIGLVCFDATLYSCPTSSSGNQTRLCPKGCGVCKNACYQTSVYSCGVNGLQQLATKRMSPFVGHLPLAHLEGKLTLIQPFCHGTCQSPIDAGISGNTANLIGRASSRPKSQTSAKNCMKPFTPSSDWLQSISALPTSNWFVPYYTSAASGVPASVYAIPYTTKATSSGFSMGVPSPSVAHGLPGSSDAPSFQFNLDVQQFNFRATSAFTPDNKINDIDQTGMGIMLQYFTETGGSMTIPVIRGHPYITAIYDDSTPVIDFIGAGEIGSVNGVSIDDSQDSVLVSPIASGGLFLYDIEVVKHAKVAYKFRLYISQNVQIRLSKPVASTCQSPSRSLVFDQECAGHCVVRLASYWSSFDDSGSAVSLFTEIHADVALMDASANVYPVINSDAHPNSVHFYSQGDSSFTQYFQWSTDCMVTDIESCSSSLLLNLALPHHFDLLPVQLILGDISYDTQNGIAHGVLGNSWTLNYDVHEIMGSTLEGDAFGYGETKISSHDIKVISANLDMDMTEMLSTASYGMFDSADCHAFGKYISSIARLVLIADSVKQPTIAAAGRQAIRDRLDSWFHPSSRVFPFRAHDHFTYDTVWGGIIRNDVASPADASTHSSLSGDYNNHVAQYGHFLYAIATVVKSGTNIDLSWFKHNLEYCLALARDIANPNHEADEFFPAYRYKSDWYVGHSWSSGLLAHSPHVDSSSEAVNAWYSLFLLGSTLSEHGYPNLGENMKLVGRLLITTDVHSFHYYSRMWAEPTANQALVYPTEFASLGVVGSLSGDRAEFQIPYAFGDCEDASKPFNPTWPPSCADRHLLTSEQVRYYNSLLVFLSQATPITPISVALQNRTWLSQAFATHGLSFTNPDGSVSQGFTPIGKSEFIPDYFNRCVTGHGCDSYLAFAWQSLASLGAADREKAWDEIVTYGSVPTDTTLTNILYHIASQKD